jgi:integrase
MGLSENLARKLPRLVEPPPQPRAIDIGLAAALIASLPDMGRRDKGRSSYGTQSKTKARLRVMLWTGLPPATIARILPSDVDLDARTVFVRPRRKGAGAPGATLPLVPEAVAAFRQWLSSVAWGPFSGGSMWKTFQRGVRAYKAQRDAEGIPVTLPDDLRPYDLRHTFLSWLLELTGDIVAVKEYAQHTDLRSTLRYAQRGATARVTAAIETVARVRGTASRS